MPRTMVLSDFTNDQWLSIHIGGGTEEFIKLLFLIQIICAFSLIIGYHTTISTFATWFMTCSMHTRNILVLHGGDLLLVFQSFISQFYQRQMLLFGFFLPLGEVWSLDAAFRTKQKK